MKKKIGFTLFILFSICIIVGGFLLVRARKIHSNSTKEVSLAEPILYTDLPDPDVIRVDNNYYMVSTSMHMSPGCMILKSTDLVNWHIVNYVYDVLDDNDNLALRNGKNAYSGGSWAASLRYDSGYYFVSVMSFTTNTSYIFTTDDIENGKWHVSKIKEELFYDSSILFDDDNMYIAYGNKDIFICELERYEEDNVLKVKIKEQGLKAKILSEENYKNIEGNVSPEGTHIYKINNFYYIFLICFSNVGRVELCYRSNSLTGNYNGEIVFNDSYIAQGGIFNTPDGKYYSMMFKDEGAVGRIPYLVEVKFVNDFPVFGDNGKLDNDKALKVKSIDYEITKSDEFDNGKNNYFENRSNLDGYETNISNKSLDEINKYANIELLSLDASTWSPTQKGFWIQGDAKIENINDTICVSNRVDRGEGITKEVKNIFNGYTYEIALDMYYDDAKIQNSKDSKYFKIELNLINSSNNTNKTVDVTSFLVYKKEWYHLETSYTLDTDFNFDKAYLNIKLNFWDDEEIPENKAALGYLSDFSLKKLSFKQKYYNDDFYHNGEYDYNGSNLDLAWQFNHNPDNKSWSLTDRNGFLRLYNNHITSNFYNARNTLTQRTFGPLCSGYVKIDVSHMKNGDFCGLGALQYCYGFVGVMMENDKKYIICYNTFYGDNYKPITFEEERIEIEQNEIYLKLDFIFKKDNKIIDEAYFYYSLDNKEYHQIGSKLKLKYCMENFVGYRFALFSYATKETGGYVDFDYFRILDEIF